MYFNTMKVEEAWFIFLWPDMVETTVSTNKEEFHLL